MDYFELKKPFICDSHNDFLTELNCNQFEDYINKCDKENVKIICSSFWTSKMNKVYINNELSKRAELLRKYNDNYLLHVEDLWWVERDNDLKKLISLKPFSCSLTWNEKNALAGGSLSNGDLTKWGRFCIDKLLTNSVLIDTAHLNRKSFYQVAGIVRKNLYCSHTAFYGLKRHKRNLTDKQIEIIVNSGGFIGMFFYHKALKIKDDFTVCDIARNLKYFTSLWGYDNIGLGSDFFGIEIYPKDLVSYDDFDKLIIALKNEGFSDGQIKKILYQNFIDFLKRINYKEVKNES